MFASFISRKTVNINHWRLNERCYDLFRRQEAPQLLWLWDKRYGDGDGDSNHILQFHMNEEDDSNGNNSLGHFMGIFFSLWCKKKKDENNKRIVTGNEAKDEYCIWFLK